MSLSVFTNLKKSFFIPFVYLNGKNYTKKIFSGQLFCSKHRIMKEANDFVVFYVTKVCLPDG